MNTASANFRTERFVLCPAGWQYGLADRARELGFKEVTVIDENLGRSGSGLVERPGFQRLVAEVCSGEVGAVFCIEESRLARNGRDWRHLIELCGMVGSVVVDPDGIYDPAIINDRLLLGRKGTMSEFELNLPRLRSVEAIRQKASHGEVQFLLLVGLCLTQVICDGRRDGAADDDENLPIPFCARMYFEMMRRLENGDIGGRIPCCPFCSAFVVRTGGKRSTQRLERRLSNAESRVE